MKHFTVLSLAESWLLTLLMAAGSAAQVVDLRLVDAARNRDQQAVRALLNQQADVNGRSADGATALLWAAHWNDLETADLLIRAGANVNAANDFRITPLSLACTNGSAALVERLLKAGANPDTAIATGETPIMTCASSGSADAVRMLIARGADVNAKEPSQTPDRVDVGRRRTSCGRGPNAHRARGRPSGAYAERDSPRCTLRRGRATWRSRGCCWPRAWT